MKHITQSVCDMNRNKLCEQYDSETNPAGQATDIKVTRELNGWKEISFALPRAVNGEPNFRWDFIQSESLLRYTKGDAVDWYVIHAPTKSHSGLNVKSDVKCSHLCSQLNKKNLYFEFDDENGIGTLQALAAKALAGSGWTLGACDTFFEKDGATEKVRSIKSNAKRGAYLLIQDLCKLFSAYPVYDADSMTVSLYSLNAREGYLELNYGKNLKSLDRKENSENIVTRLYVEGEYGDYGYVGIDDVNPTGLPFLLNFSYYNRIGLFTAEHQAALDRYIERIKYEKDMGMALAAMREAKRTEQNSLWGQYSFILYILDDGAVSRTILGGKATDEKRELAAGDELAVLLGDGTHRYVTYEDGMAFTNDVTHIVKYVTKPGGIIGGKEVAVESKHKSIATLRKDLDRPYTSEEKKQSIRAQIAELETGIRLLYTGNEGAEGLYAQMARAVRLAVEAEDLGAQLTLSLDRQAQIEIEFAEAMGEMLKDGYWSNDNYTVGQERFLYEDALDMMAVASQPEVSYSVSAVNLAHISGYEQEAFDLNMTLRLYDAALDVNDCVYITKMVEHPATPWDDTITISTDRLDTGAKTLESILSRINEIAALIDQKNALYERARAIGRDGSIPLKLLEGTIDVMKTKLTSAVSNWYTDDSGNIVLESLDGQSAMKLCGEGFMIANGKTEDGNWEWRTFGTGKGFTADMIVTGYLSADRIEAESITANKLSSDVGRSLDLSSNTSINLRVADAVMEAVGYRVEITSNNGMALSEHVNRLALAAHVWHGGEDVTGQLSPAKFAWTRKSDDAQADAGWNAAHVGMKGLVLTHEDVCKSATFDCHVDVGVSLATGRTVVTDLTDFVSDPIPEGAEPPADPTEGMLWLDTSEPVPMLRRWDGEQWMLVGDQTDEILGNVDVQLAEYETKLEATTRGILSQVSEKYAPVSELASITQQLSTLATQTSSNYTWTVSQLAALQDETIGSTSQLSTQLLEIMTYMTFDQTGLTIGKSGNPMKMKISNERVSILQNDNEIAYFSGSRLYVKSGEFLQSMKLGNFEFVPQSNGNLSFVKATG